MIPVLVVDSRYVVPVKLLYPSYQLAKYRLFFVIKVTPPSDCGKAHFKYIPGRTLCGSCTALMYF